MRKINFTMILVFSLFLMFSSKGYGEPILLSNTSNISETYNSSFIFEFKSVWNTTENITKCNFTLGRPDGSITNYSITPNSTVPPSCYINFTQDRLGPAGSYNFSWSVKNNTNWFIGNTWNFTIERANATLNMPVEINGDDADKNLSYGIESNVTAWEFNKGDDDCNYSFYRGNINLSKNFSEVNLLGAGTYYYTYNVTDCENYTSGSKVRILTIYPKNESIYLYLNDLKGNRTDENSYDLYDIAEFKVFLNVSNETVFLNSSYPGWVSQNGTSSISQNITFNVINLTHTGLFNLTAYWNGNGNYTPANRTYYFGVKPYCINNISNPPSGQTYSPGKEYNFSIKCIGDIKSVSFEWDGIRDVAENTSNIFYYNLKDQAAGNHSYKWHATDVKNNTFNSTSYSYVINKAPINLTLMCSDLDWSITSGTTVNFICTANNPVRMIINIGGIIRDSGSDVTSFSSGDVTGLTSNTYVYCSTPNSNYSIEGNWENWLTVITTPTYPTTGDTGDTGISGSFLIKDLVSSLIVEAGSTKSISFDLSNTLNNNLVDVNISISGINSNWYRLSRDSISNLKRNIPEPIAITFDIPENAEAENYSITITAKGRIIGSTTTRITTKAMKLVITPKKESESIPTPETTKELLVENETEENVTSNETSLGGPTGFAAIFEYLKNNLVITFAVIACLLIFIFRNNITTGLMKVSGKRVAKKKPSKIKLPRIKMPDYKLIIGLKRGRKKKTEIEEVEIKRPEILEREIKRDIKELRQILETEEKLKKKRKKFNLENN